MSHSRNSLKAGLYARGIYARSRAILRHSDCKIRRISILDLSHEARICDIGTKSKLRASGFTAKITNAASSPDQRAEIANRRDRVCCNALRQPPTASIYRRHYIPIAIDVSRRPRSRYHAPRIFDSATYRMLRSRSDQEYPTTSGIMSNMS